MGAFLVPTGRIIKEYLDERGISQKDLAHRIDVSEKHISNLLNGKTRLTEDMALKLERVMPDVSAGYWLNYEAKYQEYLAREKEQEWLEGLDLKAIAERFHFKEVFKGAKMTLTEQAIEMLKLLGVSSFDQYRYALPNTAIEFMQDGGEPEAVVVWLKLCEDEVEEQNADLSETPYSKRKLERVLRKLKAISSNPNLDNSLKSCRKLLNSVGIYLVEVPAVRNCKVRGALTTYKGHPAIYISRRFKFHDYVWFAIIHELAHLLLHYSPKETFVAVDDLASDDDKDREANEYARDFFVAPDAYDAFIAEGSYDPGSVRRFAKAQGTTAGMVAAFLQHDGKIDYSELSGLRM